MSTNLPAERTGKQTPLRISVSLAATMFGVSDRTIRSALKQGKLQYIVVRNRYKINFESLLSWSQKSTRRRNKRDSKGVGRFVNQWRIKNTKYSPNPELLSS
jgi:excisionase family DNA binding protein